MERKNYWLITIIIIVAAGFWLKIQHNNDLTKSNDAFRNTTHLILTKHARCRMDCRHITEKEIIEIVHDGKINYAKSGKGSKGYDTYALEGYSSEHQHVRVVVAPEDDGLVVITCIDLDNEWACNCD